MSQQLYRILYCSKNLIGGLESQQDTELAAILQKARANNQKKEVTGALLYNSGYFAQVLEGPRTSIESIFERIQRDSRHGDVTVLEFENMEQRDFPEWSMAHVHPPTQVQASSIGTALHEAMSNPEAAGHNVLGLLRSLVIQED